MGSKEIMDFGYTSADGRGALVNNSDNSSVHPYTDYSGNHNHSLNINSTGESGTDKNLPRYYALAFIMKLLPSFK